MTFSCLALQSPGDMLTLSPAFYTHLLGIRMLHCLSVIIIALRIIDAILSDAGYFYFLRPAMGFFGYKITLIMLLL